MKAPTEVCLNLVLSEDIRRSENIVGRSAVVIIEVSSIDFITERCFEAILLTTGQGG